MEPVYERLFLKYYGEDGNQEGVDLLVDVDGAMILLGNSTVSQTNPTTIPFILKTDPLGNVLWQRQLGELNEKAVDIEFDNNDNLIVVSNYAEGNDSRVRVYRLSQTGTGMDSLKIDFQEKQVGKSVTVTADNRVVIAGFAAPDPDRNDDSILPSEDLADVIILEVDPPLDVARIISQTGGGEKDGSGVKVFEDVDGNYTLFGYTDRPLTGTTYKKSFEVIGLDIFGVPTGLRYVTGISSEVQIASSAIETVELPNVGYLMVGTSYANTLSSNIYITRYPKELKPGDQFDDRNAIAILLNRRLEGVSAAAAAPDSYYVLANEIRENNKRDISLIKLTTDGAFVGSITFGTLEGDDTSGAVRVLPDGRVAVFGTMELETQKKMVLITLNPQGKFSN